jgi:hypothetical protein
MPRHTTHKPKSYGRQKKDKTTRTVSIEKDVLERAQREAEKHGLSLSALVNGVLKGTIKIGLLTALISGVPISERTMSNIIAKLLFKAHPELSGRIKLAS